MRAPEHTLPRTAVVYLARGADPEPLHRFESFVRSYKRFTAGEEHSLFVIFKGFESDKTLKEGQAVFSSLSYHPLLTPDDAFDLGAYRDAAHQIDLERLCFFNTNSEIVAENWLRSFPQTSDFRMWAWLARPDRWKVFGG